MAVAGKKQEKNPVKVIVSSGLAGAIEICITYPTEFLKTQIQLKDAGARTMPEAAKEVYAKNGIKGFYRGLSPLFWFSIPKSAVRFSSFEFAKSRLADQNGKLSTTGTLTAGLFAGVMEAILVVTPQETLKVKLVHDILSPQPRFRGFIHGINTIVAEQGLASTYRGLAPTIFKQGTNQMIRFGTYEPLMQWMADKYAGGDKKNLSAAHSMISGVIAGAASVFGNTPIDVIKTRMQGLDGSKYASSLECAKEIYRDSGIIGFYKGTVPRLARVCMDVAIVMTLYNEIQKLLDTAW